MRIAHRLSLAYQALQGIQSCALASARLPSCVVNFRCSIIGSSELRAGPLGQRIYHLPFQFHYEKTRIDEGAGERWVLLRDGGAPPWRCPLDGRSCWRSCRPAWLVLRRHSRAVAGVGRDAQRLIEVRMHVADYLDRGQGLSLVSLACLLLALGGGCRRPSLGLEPGGEKGSPVCPCVLQTEAVSRAALRARIHKDGVWMRLAPSTSASTFRRTGWTCTRVVKTARARSRTRTREAPARALRQQQVTGWPRLGRWNAKSATRTRTTSTVFPRARARSRAGSRKQIDQFAAFGFGHQWKVVFAAMRFRSCARVRHRSARTASSASRVSKWRLATGSSTSGQRCSAGCSSGV